ncbi:MAG: hypothetical protein ACD_75C02569G0001, partial [uncultured bacterium]
MFIVQLVIGYLFAHFFHVEGNFRDENHIGPAGNAGIQGNPSGVAAHDFDHHDPVMGFRRGMKLIQGFGGGGYRGIEAEGTIRLLQVVVDGFRHTDHRHSLEGEFMGDIETPVAPDGDVAIKAHSVEIPQDLVRYVDYLNFSGQILYRSGKRIALTGRAKDRPSGRIDALDIPRIEANHLINVQKAAISILTPIHFPTFSVAYMDHGIYDGIETRSITTTRRYHYLLHHQPLCMMFSHETFSSPTGTRASRIIRLKIIRVP